MKKLLLTAGVGTLAVAGIVAAGPLSANAETAQGTTTQTTAQLRQHMGNGGGYGYQASLETRAAIVGMTPEQLQTALKTQTMSQIAAAKGLTQEQFEEKMEAAATARWQAMGLTSEQIAERLAAREQRQQENHSTHEWGSGDGVRYHGGMNQ